MNGRLIIKLPTSLSASIVSEGLSVKDRLRLDSAFCQVSVREEFLQLTRSPELSVKSWVQDHKSQANRALVSWALIREVYVEKLLVERESDPDLYNTYLQKFRNRVFVLRMNCPTITSLANSIATCCNLIVLKVHNWKLSATLRDVFMFCRRLREFCSHSCRDPDPAELPLTSVHLETVVCNSLKYLELIYCDVDLVAAFLRMAVAVEVVVLRSDFISLNGIPESMSLTTNTLVLNVTTTIDESLANFAARGEQLENLSFARSEVTTNAITALCNFPYLRALDLTDVVFEADDYLSVLASSCGDKLTELLLFGCEPTLPPVTVQEALPLFTKLQSFSFYFENCNTDVWNMSSYSRLTKLSLAYCGDDLADELVSQLTEHCYVNIRELSLCMVPSDLAAERLAILVSICTKLRCLNVQDVTYTDRRWWTEEEIAKWKSLRPGLVVGGKCEHYLQLNVFAKYECCSVWFSEDA